MKLKFQNKFLLLIPHLFILIPFFYSGYALSAVEKNFGINVSSRYEDNVFRNDKSDNASQGIVGDFVTVSSVNAGFISSFSKQDLSLNFNLSDQRYKSRQNLNSKPISLGLNWGYRPFNNLSNSLSITYSSQTTEFEDSFIKDKNIIKRRNIGYKINYQPYSKVEFGIGIQYAELSNSLIQLQQKNRINKTVNINGSYQLTSSIIASLNHSLTESSPLDVTDKSLEFDQSASSIALIWALSEKTSLNTSFGQSSVRDRESISYNFGLNYLFSSKTNFNLSLYQTLAESNTEISLLTESKGFVLSLGWELSPKINSNISFNRVEQASDTVFLNGLSSEFTDIVTTYQAGLSYRLNRVFSLSSSIIRATRKSELVLSDYEVNKYLVSLNLSI